MTDWASAILILCITVLIILFIGDPDMHDVIKEMLMKGGGCNE